jgi:hypothetical protein
MDSERRKLLGFYKNYEWIPKVYSLSCLTYVVFHDENNSYLQRHKNKVMLFIKIVENYYIYGLVTSKTARVLYQLRIHSISLITVKQDILYISLFLFLDSKSQEESHVIFNDRRKILIYMDSAHRNLLGFYTNYEWIPQI